MRRKISVEQPIGDIREGNGNKANKSTTSEIQFSLSVQ